LGAAVEPSAEAGSFKSAEVAMASLSRSCAQPNRWTLRITIPSCHVRLNDGCGQIHRPTLYEMDRTAMRFWDTCHLLSAGARRRFVQDNVASVTTYGRGNSRWQPRQ